MWPNPQFPANLVTITEVILNGKLHFLCSEWLTQEIIIFTYFFQPLDKKTYLVTEKNKILLSILKVHMCSHDIPNKIVCL